MAELILGVQVATTSYKTSKHLVREWVHTNEGHFVCAANVHMLMEAWDDPAFKRVVNAADMVTPDGMPLVWILRLKGYKNQQRVYGPTLMLHVLKMAARENIPVGFYGGRSEVLERLINRMQIKFPGLSVAFSHSPPFRVLNPDEDLEIVSRINESGSRILFISLGCPKQERWMAEHRDQISAVMLGVGAAFDFHAQVVSQAPNWIQGVGMEWLYRFFQEPVRLWKRYLIHNPRFVVLALADMLGMLKTH